MNGAGPSAMVAEKDVVGPSAMVVVSDSVGPSLRHVKAVQDFSAGCSTSIRPQIDVPFIK